MRQNTNKIGRSFSIHLSKLRLHYWSAQQPNNKSLKEAILETHHFGTPKILPRLITFWSAASALPEVNTTMQAPLQRCPCLAELHAWRGQWLNSFWMHNTSCVIKTCILTNIIRFLKCGRIEVLKSAKCTCTDMSVNMFVYKSEAGYEEYRNYFLITPITLWNCKTSI